MLREFSIATVLDISELLNLVPFNGRIQRAGRIRDKLYVQSMLRLYIPTYIAQTIRIFLIFTQAISATAPHVRSKIDSHHWRRRDINPATRMREKPPRINLICKQGCSSPQERAGMNHETSKNVRTFECRRMRKLLHSCLRSHFGKIKEI